MGCRLRVVSRDDRMRCGVLGVVICLFWPSRRLYRYDGVFRGKGHSLADVCWSLFRFGCLGTLKNSGVGLLCCRIRCRSR